MNKIVKKLILFLSVIALLVSTSVTSFAAESSEIAKTESETQERSNVNVSPYATYDMVRGTITPNSSYYGTLKLYPSCDNGGLLLKLHVSTSSTSSSGALLLSLYNPEGEYVSSDWIIGTNDEAVFSVPFAFSAPGRYTLQIDAQGITSKVTVNAYFTSLL